MTAGNQTTAQIQLTAASLSSIQVIGRVTTDAARTPLNTSTAAIATVSGQSLLDFGQLNVGTALNAIPGVTVQLGTGYSNGSYLNALSGGGTNPFLGGFPTLRGSLQYETASLIDGHPINLGLDGTFNPAFINPYILQDVQIVKGPGAAATNINYAIGGTINYRTLEPTQAPHQSADLGYDEFGGQSMNLRATGTLPDGKLGYAFDYADFGTPGWERGWDTLNPVGTGQRARSGAKLRLRSPRIAPSAFCFAS